jgi:hypothetical protein
MDIRKVFAICCGVTATATGCAARVTSDLPPIPVSALECRPGTVRAGDTLTIEVPRRMARELSIETPRGVFFQLVGVAEDPAAGPRLMTSDSLQSLRELRLSVSGLTGRPYVHGATGTERVFAATGTYTIRIAEVLGTDDGTPVAVCEVAYRGQ